MSDQPSGITLVTGAAGFVGNNLVRHLLQLGRPVRALIHVNDKSLKDLPIERVVCDTRDLEGLKRACKNVDVVYHAAAVISIDDDEQRRQLDSVNVQGTGNLVQACLEANVRRLVHFSSIHALSWQPKNTPIDESRGLALDPAIHLPYDRSKAEAELQVLDGVRRGLDAVILNPVGIFGPHDFTPSASGDFLLQLAARRLPGLVNGGYHWVDVRDVATAAVVAEQRGRCGQRYILTSEFASFPSIARWVRAITGTRPPLTFPIWLGKAVAPLAVMRSRRAGVRPLFTPESLRIITCHQLIETTRAEDEFDFHPRPVRESIHDAIRWLLEETDSGSDRLTAAPVPVTT